MGVFDRFRRDASEEWPKQKQQSLTLDLRVVSLNGIPLGAPSTDLSLFGRPSNSKPFSQGQFRYDLLGIVIELEDECVSYFGLPFCRRNADEVGPCNASIIFPGGTEISVSAETLVETLLPHLPAETGRDTDEDETVYTFTLDGSSLEIEVSSDGLVCRLNTYHE